MSGASRRREKVFFCKSSKTFLPKLFLIHTAAKSGCTKNTTNFTTVAFFDQAKGQQTTKATVWQGKST